MNKVAKLGFGLDNYDPSFYEGNSALAQVTFEVKNLSADAKTIEMFGTSRSFANIFNAAIGVETPASPNLLVAAADMDGLIFFDQFGVLTVQDAAGAKMTVRGLTKTYREIFDAIAAGTRYKNEKLRYQFTNEPQLANEITLFRRTPLGGDLSNVINPSTFFDPNQQQTKVVDLPVDFEMNKESGLRMLVNAGETVILSFFLREA